MKAMRGEDCHPSQRAPVYDCATAGRFTVSRASQSDHSANLLPNQYSRMRHPRKPINKELDRALDEVALTNAKLKHAKNWARLLWRLVRADRQLLAVDAFDFEDAVIIDAAFDAAQQVWDRHNIYIEPLAPAGGWDHRFSGHRNDEKYIALHPGGEKRTIDRSQLLMMGGQVEPDAIFIEPK